MHSFLKNWLYVDAVDYLSKVVVLDETVPCTRCMNNLTDFHSKLLKIHNQPGSFAAVYSVCFEMVLL